MMETLEEIRHLSTKIAVKRSNNMGRKSDINNILEGLEGIASRLSMEIKNKDYVSRESNDDNRHDLLVM